MKATIARRRKHTAARTAQELGLHPRTVRKMMAESRADYLTRAKLRREFVAQQRAKGVPLAQIAAAMNTTVWAVKSLYKQARARAGR